MVSKECLFDIKMDVAKYAIIDLETTGLSYENDDILEIAVKTTCNKKIEFHSLVNTKKIISADITAINGITNEKVKYAPEINYILNNIYGIFSGYTLVAHNAHNFDAKFIVAKGGLLFYDFKFLDTKDLAEFVLPGFGSGYSMTNLCKLFGIEIVEQHTAIGDVNALASLFDKLVRLLDRPETINKFVKSGSIILKELSR